jgi:hypothetical protein
MYKSIFINQNSYLAKYGKTIESIGLQTLLIKTLVVC